MVKPGHSGVRRLVFAMSYSAAGLAWAWRHEAAFRQEALLVAVLAPLGLYLGKNGVERALLLGTLLLVLMIELLNTAVEAVVDRVGDGPHPLAKAAKDMGSAAVLVSLVTVVVVWVLVLV